MDQGAILADEHYHIVCFNTTAGNMVRKVLGKQLSTGDSVFSYCDQRLQDQFMTALGLMRAGRTLTWQNSFLVEDPVVYRYSLEAFKSAQGFSGMLIKLMDITEHVRLEEALVKSNERYRLATRASYDMIWERDFASDHYFFSEALLDNYGYDNLEKWTWANVMNKLVHPEDRESTMVEAQRVTERFNTFLFENRYRHADGTYRWMVWTSLSKPEEGLVYGVALSYSNRRDAEQDLERTLQEVKSIFSDLGASHAEIAKLREGLVTFCAWTKQIFYDDRWMSVDEFLANHLRLNLTHGISDEALKVMVANLRQETDDP